MRNTYQTSIRRPIIFEGIGLHTGLNSKVTLQPSEANSGIIFKRTDLKNNNCIKANYKNVTSAKLCTTLENQFGAKVSTVEHLLAALFIAEIDNVIIELNTEEVPIMDGSAKDFLEVLKNSEIETLSKKRNYFRVFNKIDLVDGDRKISLEPSDETLEVEFQLNYENKVIGNQKNTINFDKDNLDDVTKSRTFCLFQDIEKIKKAGLAKGGSLDNAVVVDGNKIINQDGLRNDKEFVNHKILDLVGDLTLSGSRILGKIRCYQGGHLLTNMFLRKLFTNPDNYLKKIPEEKNTQQDNSITHNIQVAVNA